MAVIAHAVKAPRADRRTALLCFLVGALAYGPQLRFFFAAIDLMPTSIVVAIAYVYPTLVLIFLAVLRRKPPAALEVLLVAVTLGGVAAVTLGGGGTSVDGRGLLYAMISAIVFAVYVIVANPLTRRIHPMRMSVYVLCGIGASSSLSGIVLGGLTVPSNISSWEFVALHGLVMVPLAFTAFYAGLRLLGPARTAMVDTAQPVVALAVGVGFLGEGIAPVQVSGIVTVIVAIGCMSALDERRARETTHGSGVPEL